MTLTLDSETQASYVSIRGCQRSHTPLTITIYHKLSEICKNTFIGVKKTLKLQQNALKEIKKGDSFNEYISILRIMTNGSQ